MKTRRRRHRRASIGIAVTAAAGLLLAACSSSGTSAGSNAAAAGGTSAAAAGGSSSGTLPHTLVFSPLSLQVPALKGLATGVQAYAKAKDWTVQLQDPNFNAGTQQTELNDVISSGVAGALWIISVNPSALGSTLKAAQAKGIPALVNGVPADYGFSGLQPGITFDVINYKEAGTALGQQLGACINKKLGGNAEVLFSRSAVGTAGKADIENSAAAALVATAPKAKIVSNMIATAQASAQTDAGNSLQGNPGITAAMATNDEGALGVLGAFAAAGKNLTCMTSFGGGAEVLAQAKAGKIYAVANLQFAADMTQSFNTLQAMQSNPKQVGQQLHVPLKIVMGS